MNFSIFSLVTLVLVVLKLCKVIAWSWWLVFLPTFIGVAITLVVLTFALYVALKD